MNAAEARKKRDGSTLLERTMADPARAARIKRLVELADIERIVETIMENDDVSAAELARRINAKPPQISRDLHGGLRRATLGRLALIAHALDYDFVPALVPRNNTVARERFFDAYRELLPPLPAEAGEVVRPTVAPQKSKGKKREKVRTKQLA
jgi:transcriptional regulator with XRE-family HTH domain